MGSKRKKSSVKQTKHKKQRTRSESNSKSLEESDSSTKAEHNDEPKPKPGQFWAEKIVDATIDRNGSKYYLIKWCDYDESDNTWEPEKNVLHCDVLMDAFALTLNGRQPIKRSFEEINKFCTYFRHIIHESSDLQLISMVSNKSVKDLYSVRVLREVKKSIKHNCSEVFAKMNRIIEQNNKNRNTARDLMEYSALKMVSRNFNSVSHFFDYYERRLALNEALKKASKRMNSVITKGNEGTPIGIENNVDFERPPEFSYVTQYVLDQQLAKDIKVFDESEDKAIYSCECVNCFDDRDECCTAVIGFPMVYSKKALLTTKVSGLVFECNSNCKCDSSCNNRVVQKGRKYKLSIFRTEKAMRGWGVRTMERIPKGSFVTEYTGEIISDIEAMKRPNTYFYHLGDCLDRTYSGDDEDFTYLVDAYNYGNVARFINHSCNPNCTTMCIYVDAYDNCVPRIAIFAIRSIAANEELTYDYNMGTKSINDYTNYLKNEKTNPENLSVNEGNQNNDSIISQENTSTLEVNQNGDAIASTSGENNVMKTVKREGIRSPNSKLNRRSITNEDEQIKCLCGDPYCRGFLY